MDYEEQSWVYKFALPVYANPEPVFIFFGWVNFAACLAAYLQ
jgi:hypothetical protein